MKLAALYITPNLAHHQLQRVERLPLVDAHLHSPLALFLEDDQQILQ